MAIIASGNISGSHVSTGSFGNVFATHSINISTTGSGHALEVHKSSNQSPIFAYDGYYTYEIGSGYLGYSPNSNGLRIFMSSTRVHFDGINGNTAFKFRTNSKEHFRIEGNTGDVTIFSGSLFLSGSHSGNISGSGLTTGSFGYLLVDGEQVTSSPVKSYTNASNNRILTSVDSETINGESALTFDGSQLTHTASGNIAGKLVFSGGGAATGYNYFMNASNDGGTKAVHFVNGSNRSADNGPNVYTIRNDGGELHLGRSNQITTIDGNDIRIENGNVSVTKSFPDIFTKSNDEGRIGFMDTGGAIQSGMKNNSGDLILIADGNTERLRITDTKISGSATSTGSFGRLVVGRGSTDSSYSSTTGGDVAFGVDASGKRIILEASHVEIGPTDYFAGNSFTKDGDASLFVQTGIHIFTSGNNQGMRIYNTYGNSYNSYVERAGNSWGGTSLDGGHLVLRNYGSGGTQVWHGSNVVVDVKASATGSSTLLTLEDNKISGSAVSTGSFGQLDVARNAVVDNKLLVNTTNDARSHVIIADGTIGGPTFSGTYIDPRGGHLILQGNNSVTVRSDLIPGYDYDDVNARDIGSTSYRWNDIHFGGNISGSSATTGSFGSIISSGSVGIGTPTPTNRVTVFGHGTSNATAPVVQLSQGIGTHMWSGIRFAKSGTNKWGIVSDYAANDTKNLVVWEYESNAARMYFKTGGYVGIGNTNPGRKLDVTGDIGASTNIVAGTALYSNELITRSGNTLTFKTSGGTAIATFMNTGRVGIGTTNPAFGLDVRSTGYFATASTVDQLRLGDTTNGKVSSIRAVNDTMSFKPDGSNTKFFIGNTGKIGIGTTSPSAKLHVDGDAIVTGKITAQEFHTEFVSASIQFQSGSTKFGDTQDDVHNFTGSLHVTGSEVSITAQSPMIKFHDTNTSNLTHRILGGGNIGLEYSADINNTGAGYHRWDLGNAERMRLTEAGNLGINVTNPTYELDVQRNGLAEMRVKATASGRARLHIDGYNDIAEIYFARAGSNLGAIYQESDGTKLNIYGFGGSSYGYEIITCVYSNGRVGIKQHSPSFDLDVTGTGRFTGALQVDGGINATAVGDDIHLGNGLPTTPKIRFGTSSWANNYGLESYWSVFSTNSNEGYRFKDSGGNELLRIQGNTSSGGAGTRSFNVLGVLVPMTDSSVSIGTSSLRWTNIFTDAANIAGAVTCGSIVEGSSIVFKENITQIEGSLEKINKLRGVEFDYKDTGEHSIGMIAEEVNEVFPELVEKDDDGKITALSYSRMTAVLLEAVKELTEEVRELKARHNYSKSRDEE